MKRVAQPPLTEEGSIANSVATILVPVGKGSIVTGVYLFHNLAGDHPPSYGKIAFVKSGQITDGMFWKLGSFTKHLSKLMDHRIDPQEGDEIAFQTFSQDGNTNRFKALVTYDIYVEEESQ